MSALLFGTSPTDVATFAGAATLLVADRRRRQPDPRAAREPGRSAGGAAGRVTSQAESSRLLAAQSLQQRQADALDEFGEARLRAQAVKRWAQREKVQ